MEILKPLGLSQTELANKHVTPPREAFRHGGAVLAHLSFVLESGSYIVHSVGAVYDHFPVTGGGPVPLNLKTEIRSNSIAYLGHLDIVMRERKKESEERAGPIRPLLDQNPAVGAYGGTFDVVVEDKFEEDMKLFISEYPALKKFRGDIRFTGLPEVRAGGYR